MKNSTSSSLHIPSVGWGIFIVSMTSLLLETLLIRWIGTEIRIFAYLQNIILIACVLGLGLGAFTSTQSVKLRQILIPLAIVVAIIVFPISHQAFGRISEFLTVHGENVIWGTGLDQGLGSSGWLKSLFVMLIGLAMTYIILMLIVDMFVPLGQILGKLINQHTNTTWAYSINILGGVIGTWLFALLSYFYFPPFVWFLTLAILLIVLSYGSTNERTVNSILIIFIVLLSIPAGRAINSIETVWSPYQKLAVEKVPSGYPDHYQIWVNNVGYQVITDLRSENTSRKPDMFSAVQKGLSQYDIPLLLHPSPKDVLIVGAGTGNDASGALRNRAQNITAVEIDPAIIEIGRKFHPEKPYDSPIVNIVNDDARSFFATTQYKYDLISFGLLDSHTTTSLTNARLDHYVYTQESITQAASLLKPGGVLTLMFEVGRPYIGERIRLILLDIFGEEPITFRIPNNDYGVGGVMFIAGDLNSVNQQLGTNERLGSFIRDLQKATPSTVLNSPKVTTDDWPYFYLENPKIPFLYFWISGLIILIFMKSYKKWTGENIRTFKLNRNFWHFFCLGAAFLLLEVQNISKASVVLGNTWVVNTIIISSILMMALLANWVSYKFPKLPLSIIYSALIITTVGLYFIDLARFAFLPYTIKAIVTGGLTSLPMLFSGIVFIRSFSIVPEKDKALGANLLGAMLGALLQSITFAIGIRALLLVVAVFYIISFLTSSRNTAENKI